MGRHQYALKGISQNQVWHSKLAFGCAGIKACKTDRNQADDIPHRGKILQGSEATCRREPDPERLPPTWRAPKPYALMEELSGRGNRILRRGIREQLLRFFRFITAEGKREIMESQMVAQQHAGPGNQVLFNRFEGGQTTGFQ